MCACATQFSALSLVDIGLAVCYISLRPIDFVRQSTHTSSSAFDMTRAHTSVRLEPAHQEQLREIAERRSTNVTALINQAVAQFVREEGLRDELRGIERRLTATALQTRKETARVGDDVQLLIAQVDQLMKFVFQATPEIFDKDAAAIVGSRRYAGFVESFPNQFTGRKRRALFAADVNDEETGTKDSRED